MKYTKYLTIIIGLLLIIVIGELTYLFFTDIYPRLIQKNKPVLNGNNSKSIPILQSNTPYNFNDYEKGNYFIYTNDQDIQKLYITFKINGSLKEEGEMYILPVSLVDKSINLILGYPERKILFQENSKEKDFTLNATPLQGAVNTTLFKNATYIRISLPLTEYPDKKSILNDSRCDRACKQSLLLMEKQITANGQFADLLKNEDKFDNTKIISDIGPILDLIIIN